MGQELQKLQSKHVKMMTEGQKDRMMDRLKTVYPPKLRLRGGIKIVNFLFSHYKSMGTISCHSNQSSYLTGIKNTTFVEANVLSMYAKFQLHPPYGFCKEDF